jgi:DNA-binding MurR/RpiR family transcriptional regulator
MTAAAAKDEDIAVSSRGHATRPLAGTLRERLDQVSPLMAPTTRRIALYLAASPERAVTSSAIAIAVACETSDASVIRAIRQLGYDGMIDFKRALAQELAAPAVVNAETAMEQTLRRVAAREETVSTPLEL